jgi:hypothetical protein
MTDVLDLSGFPFQAPLVPPDDPIFDFAVSNWLDPPVYVTNLPETTPESDIRSLAEQEYRKSTSPTLWHRYLKQKSSSYHLQQQQKLKKEKESLR